MRHRLLLAVLSLLPAACFVSTEKIEGSEGPQGPAGTPGSQPFLFSGNGTDVYYEEGNLILGADALGPEQFNFYPIAEVAGTRGTLGVRTTTTDGIATIRLTGPGADHVDDWHINANAGDKSTLGIYPIAKSDGPALLITNQGDIGIGTTTPTATLTVGQATAGDDKNYAISVERHGTTASPGQYASNSPALSIRDWATDGPATLDQSALVSIYAPRIEDIDPNSSNALLLDIGSDDGAALVVNAHRSVGIGTRAPIATLDVNGTARLARNSAPPVACDAVHDGTITLTSKHVICVCDGSQWVRGADGSTPCTW